MWLTNLLKLIPLRSYKYFFGGIRRFKHASSHGLFKINRIAFTHIIWNMMVWTKESLFKVMKTSRETLGIYQRLCITICLFQSKYLLNFIDLPGWRGGSAKGCKHKPELYVLTYQFKTFGIAWERLRLFKWYPYSRIIIRLALHWL